MKDHHSGTLLTLGAIWGASYVFMRLGGSEFGALSLAGLRAFGAVVVMLPVLLLTREHQSLFAHWKPIAVVGITNSALPFVLFNYAALHISTGLASVLSAAAPLFAGVIAVMWLKQRLPAQRWLGLLIGFAGVFGLALTQTHASLAINNDEQAWAVAACLAATLLYGVTVNFTRKYLTGVPPLAVATGSQLSAAIVLAPLAIWAWPEQSPSATAWASALALAVLCSAVAYVLFFRLIAQMGQTRAIAVTFLIPLFGVLWGALFFAEVPTAPMLLGCAFIALGTALSTGWLVGKSALATPSCGLSAARLRSRE